MKLNFVYGDIINEIESGNYDAVAHGCNCMGIMGAGVAKLLNEYTGGQLLKVDRMTTTGDINKMGTYTSYMALLDGSPFHIYNLYTQFKPIQKDERCAVHWISFESAMIDMIFDLFEDYKEPHILIPPIGCGLAGGSLKDFSEHLWILSHYFEDSITTSVVFNDLEMMERSMEMIIKKKHG